MTQTKDRLKLGTIEHEVSAQRWIPEKDDYEVFGRIQAFGALGLAKKWVEEKIRNSGCESGEVMTVEYVDAEPFEFEGEMVEDAERVEVRRHIACSTREGVEWETDELL